MEAKIIAAIVHALLLIAEGLLGEAVPDLLVEPVRQPLQKLIKRKGGKAGEDKALLDAFRAAITAAGCPSDDKDATAKWLMQVGLDRLAADSKASSQLRRLFAYAVLAQTSKDTLPPEDLIRALKWPRSRPAELSVLLAELRRQLYLLDDGDWKPLIDYANEEAKLKLLGDILSRIDRLFVFSPSQGEIFLNVLIRKQGLTKDEAAQIEISYKNDLVDDLSRHRLPGSDGGPVDLPLLDIFMDVGVREAKRRHQPAHMQPETGQSEGVRAQKSNLDRVTKALGGHPRLVLLGAPGAGKSIVVDYVALMFAKGLGSCGFGIEVPYIPVVARLEDFAVELKKTPTLTLERYFADSIRKTRVRSDKLPEFVTTALEKQACIVLLDGLDEVGDMRQAVIKQVEGFASRRSKGMVDCNRLVVTSRIEGYWDAPLSPSVFAHKELGPLQPPEEVREFLLRWFMALERPSDEQTSAVLAAHRAEQRVAALLPKLMANDSVKRLSTNPLLLTLLALVFEETTLPGRRVEVFQHCTDALLRTVRKSAHNLLPELLDSMSMEQIWEVLSALAYWTHASRSPGEYNSEGWRKRVDGLLRDGRGGDHDRASRETSAAGGKLADKYLTFLQRDAGLVAASQPRQLGFFHQTFQEYLAGRHIATRSTSEWRTHFREHWADPYWSEALLLAMGHVGVIEESRDDLGDMLVFLLNIDQDYVENKRPADQNIAGRQVKLAGWAVADIGVDRVPPATLRWVLTMLHDALRDWNTDLRKPFDPARLPPLTRFEIGRILDEIGWLPDDLNAWVLCRGCTSRGNRDLRDLMVMKYPVTNAQYARFVAARSYEAPQWWGGEGSDGWQWRMRPQASRGSDPVGEPAFWRDYYLGQGRRGYPVVGVSWHEANAYAAWLTAILHRARRADADLEPEDCALVEPLLDKRVVRLRLPEEVEWAKAAGSTTKYNERFPWDAQSVKPGYDFTRASMRSNTAESNLRGTSPVAMYPLGASQPFGLMDVGGNVHEWTASWYGRQQRDYAARGGSWRSWIRSALCSDRVARNPGASHDDLGFRLVATIET